MYSLPEIRLTKTPVRLFHSIVLFIWIFLLSVTVFSQQTGIFLKRCWFYPSPNLSNLANASDNAQEDSTKDNFYVLENNEKIISINTKIGEKNWDSDLGGEIASNLLVARTSVYATTNRVISTNENGGNNDKASRNTSVIYALNKVTGLPVWKTDLKFTEKMRLVDLPNGIFAVGDNGDVYLIDKMNGEILRRRTIGAQIENVLALKTKQIAVGFANGRIDILSENGGETVNQFQLPVKTNVIAEDSAAGVLIFGDAKGNVRALNQRNNRLVWRTRLGAAVSDISPNEEGLLVSSLDNFVYLISASSGELIWKRRLSGRIVAPPLIKDDFFIVASIDEPTALIVNLADGKLINRIRLEDRDFFTGQAVRTGESLVFITRLGIAGFVLEKEVCQAK